MTSPVCDAVIEQLPALIKLTDAVVVDPLSVSDPIVQVLVVFELNATCSDLSELADIEKLVTEDDLFDGWLNPEIV